MMRVFVNDYNVVNIEFRHFREYKPDTDHPRMYTAQDGEFMMVGDLVVAPKGGLTECHLLVEQFGKDASRDLYALGVARCSKNDSFNKAVGRGIALCRAIHELGTDYPDLRDTLVSAAYRAMGSNDDCLTAYEKTAWKFYDDEKAEADRGR